MMSKQQENRQNAAQKIIFTVFYTCKRDSLHYIVTQIVRLLQSERYNVAIVEKDDYHAILRINSKNYRFFKDGYDIPRFLIV